jgi:Double zinc ribbon
MSTSKTSSVVLAVIIIIAALLIFRAFFFVFPFGSVFGAFRAMRDTVPPWNWAEHTLLGFPATAIPLFIMTFLWLAVVIWVYRDAEKRGMNGLLWALLVFIGSIVALIIYLIVRTEPGRAVNGTAKEACPSCGKDVAAGFVFCPHCGGRVKPVCPSCQKPVDKSWKACPHCGTTLNP